MSREFGIKPHDLRHMKPWHIEAMVLDMERRSGA